MDVLVEVHDEARARPGAAPGIASSSASTTATCKTFEIDARDLASGWRRRIPEGCIRVGESGIFTPADVARLAQVGIRTFLVGESLMRQDDVAAATTALLAPTGA